MKKNILVLLLMLVLMGMALPVGAQIPIVVDSEYDIKTDTINVSGEVSTDKGTIPMTLIITNPDGQLAAASQTMAELDADGYVTYSFEPICLPYMASGGIYTIEVSGHFVDNKGFAFQKVLGASDLLTMLKNLKTSDNPYSVVLSDAVSFGLEESALEALNPKARQVLNTLISKQAYQLPEQISTEDDAKKVKGIYKDVCEKLAEILEIAEFSNITTQQKLLSWIQSYYKLYGFDEDSAVTAESEKKLTEYVELCKNEAEFLSRIVAKENLLTVEDIQKALYEAALLTTISKKNDYQIIDAIGSFKSFFPITSMSEMEFTNRCNAIKGKYYTSYAEVVSAMTLTSDTPTTQRPGSDWGSGGGGGGGSVSIPIKATPNQNKAKLSDLADCEWAKDAITELFNNGIISGNEKGEFKPNEKITRAEVTKILLLAKGISPSSDKISDFSDVSTDKWYAPYISAAFRAGFVKGTDDGRFLPESCVTRQDLALLIYRAFDMNGTGGETWFVDNDKISGYAKDAVSLMVSRGIINGVGNGEFAPLEAATRAQVAVMIQRAISQKG